MNLKKIEKTFVRQHDASDCGVACLLSLVRYYGGNDSLENLRRNSGTSKAGTTLLGLYQCAKNLHLHTVGAEGEINDLVNEKKEAILHIQTQDQREHFIVFYGKLKDAYVIGDPAEGVMTYSKEELQQRWLSKKCLLISKEKNFVTTNTSRKAKRKWFLSLLKPDKQVLQFSVSLGIVIAILSMSLSVFSQKLVDDILPTKEYVKLIGGVGLLALIMLVQVGLSGLREYFLVFQTHAFNVRIIDSFYSALLHLPKPFFDTRKIGELVARLNDTGRIQRVIRTVAGGAIIDVLVVVISLIFLLYYHWETAILALAFSPVYFVLIYRFNKKIIEAQQTIMKGYALNESNYINTMQGVTTIKNSRQESFFKQLNLAIYGAYQKAIFHLGKINIQLGIYAGIAGVVFIISIVGFTSKSVLENELQLGVLFAILGITGSLIPAISNLALLAIPINEAKIAFDRMFEFTSIEKESTHGQKVKTILSIAIQNASFRFIGRKPLFEEFNMRVGKGQIVGLIGNSGSGKSTLGYVLQKHYQLEEGKILINGTMALREIKTPHWRKRIGVVEQHSTVFNGSLIENITLGRTTRIERVEKFIHRYGFDQYFKDFPGGYATPLGEEGVNISAGQIKLVAFARALFNKPQLLILDEFTANMDNEMTKFVFGILLEVKKRSAILIISHKVNTLNLIADKIYSIPA